MLRLLVVCLTLLFTQSVEAKWIYHKDVGGAFAKGNGVKNTFFLSCLTGPLLVMFDVNKRKWGSGQHTVSYVFDGRSKISFRHHSKDDQGKRFYLGLGFDRRLLDHLSRKNSVEIQVDGKRLMTVPLSGSSKAIKATLQRCRSKLANLSNKDLAIHEQFQVAAAPTVELESKEPPTEQPIQQAASTAVSTTSGKILERLPPFPRLKMGTQPRLQKHCSRL